jgi:hypothetical protein
MSSSRASAQHRAGRPRPSRSGWLGGATRTGELLDGIIRALDRAYAGDVADRAAATVAGQLNTTRPFAAPAAAATPEGPPAWHAETEAAAADRAAQPTETELT